MSDEITVYWAPATFSKNDTSFDMLYREPESVLSTFMKNKLPKAQMAMCPATKNLMKNIFALKSNIDDNFRISRPISGDFAELPNGTPIGMGKVLLNLERETSFSGYVNVSYGLKWLMFSSEPVVARLTAPYFPAESICDGALFSFGQMDIGKWYRHLNLDWHIPTDTQEVSIKENQSLAYLEFLTDKKVTFKRYVATPRLLQIATETSQAPQRYGRNWPLGKRYEMARRAGHRELVLSEIKKNLVDNSVP